MVVSTRAVVALGFGLVGVCLLVGPSLGQQPDGAVQKTSQSAGRPKAPAAATFGSVDIGVVMKKYDKVKVITEEFKAAMLAKQNELLKLRNEMQQEQEVMTKLNPGSADAKKHEDRMTQLKVQMEAGRESAEREFALREAEALGTMYQEIQAMVTRVAQWRSMNYIIRVSNDPITSSDPQSAMQAIQRTVVYADPTNDITEDVVYNLNRVYKAKGGIAPKAAAGPKPAASR
jgi:Skp family chaperone for outer membrane proteins